MNHYLKILQDNKIKATAHRVAILELFHQNNHLSHTDITTKLAEKSITVSLATLYRILNDFESHNIIIKHSFKPNQIIYELQKYNYQHNHLICTKCGRVDEFISPKLEIIQHELAMQNNFKITNHSFEIYGVCKRCQ